MESNINIDDYTREFHSVVTIKFGELVEWGWYNPADPSWKWDAYNDAQYERLCQKIIARYWDREIGILPPGEWKRSFLRKLNEIMPKYKILYGMVDDLDPMQERREYEKIREIGSEFPQTLLGGHQDYASTGRDHERELVGQGDQIGRIEDIAKRWADIDVLILDELEILFSALVTVSLNAY